MPLGGGDAVARIGRRVVSGFAAWCVAFVVSSATVSAAPSVYVANQQDETISQFDASTDGALSPKATPVVSTGSSPVLLAVSPDGNNVYVASRMSVFQYDVGPDGALSPKNPPFVASGSQPIGVAVSPNGASVFVATYGEAAVYQYDVASNGTLTPKSTPKVATAPGPLLVAVSPSGGNAYVSSIDSPYVSQYDIDANGELIPKNPPTVATGPGSFGVVVGADGKSVYVSNQFSNTISQYDVGPTGELSPKSPATVATDTAPMRVAVSPDGRSVYTANRGSASVSQFDVGAGGALIPKSPPSVPAGPEPLDLAVSFDGKSLYVANRAGRSLSQYDIGSNGALTPKTTETVGTGFVPTGVGTRPPVPLPATPLTVLAPSVELAYGVPVPITYTPTFVGLLDGDTAPAIAPTCGSSATSGSPVGVYPITCSGADDPKYLITYRPGTLTITRAGTTLTAAGLRSTSLRPTARLTRSDTGTPIGGQIVTFTAQRRQVCSAQTDENGTAQCSGRAGGEFTAMFEGSGNYLPSSGSGGL